jgi:DNA-binding transcriptional LysR family regulator
VKKLGFPVAVMGLDNAIFDDLDIVDFLSLFNSTVKVADLLGLSQSSCSRRYRAFSEMLGIDFDRVDGIYAAQSNHDVLLTLRTAAQKVRTRRRQFRIIFNWLLSPLSLPDEWRLLPLATMNTGHALTLLDDRLLDLWVGGLFECQPLIGEPLHRLGPGRFAIGQSLQCVPLFRSPLHVVARRDHPLFARSSLAADDLACYPSPSLPLGVAPMLTSVLQAHGLASTPYGGSDYDVERWEGASRDGNTLSYAPAHRLAELEQRWELIPLPYELNITDVIAVISHRDVIGDPCFAFAFQQLSELLRASPLGHCRETQWVN